MSFRGPEHAASHMQTTSGKVDAERFLTEEDQGECTILRRDITSENGIFVTPCMCAFVEDKGTIDHMKGNGKCLRCMQWIAEICVGVRVRPDFMVVSRNGRPVRRSDTYSRPPKSRSFRTLWTSNAGMLVEVWIEDEFRTSINNYLLGSFHVFPTPLQMGQAGGGEGAVRVGAGHTGGDWHTRAHARRQRERVLEIEF